ncbi:MAG: DNRLRE domain-containing protein [Hamadaea sp.]|uniref:golvesin C-terminal-like domain-containing protein n=1 Tax=Hamadaea sp. TaxID=2024425 RepID=UPI0017E12CE5|nr:DNRLRE domain-containing protein [Hamadaea sp.]NUT20964.1 DNRLRE domain-containing protein [Hamadaea sp.]
MITGSGVPAFAAPTSAQQAADVPGGFWDPIRRLFGASTAPRPKAPPKSVDLKLDGVPHDDPGTKGKAWGPAKRVKELTARRTQNARFYLLSDGRMQAEVSQTPLNYRDGNTWKPIDLAMRTGSGGWAYQNVSNAFTSRFGDRSDKLVRFESGGRHIELGLAGPAAELTPRLDGSTVTYSDAASGADVVYEVTPTTLQEDFVLAKAPVEPFAVTMTIKTGGLVARQAADGSIEFTGRDGGRVLFVMPAPYMFDSKDDAQSDVGKSMSRKVAQTLTQHGSTAEITIVPDAAWLADPARQYPVTIDPTVKIQPVPSDGQDVEIYSGATGTNYNSTYQLKVGTESVNTWRSLVRFPLTGIPAGTPIDDAQLQLYYSQTHWDWSYDVALEARRVTSAWDESTATWGSINTAMAAQPAGNVIVVDDGDAGTSFSGTWPYSTNSLTAKAIGADYRYNNDATAGNTHTWTPTITEAGDYQVEVHFTAEADRSTATPYTVYYNGGSKAYTVDQTGAADGVWKTLGVHPFAAGTTGKVVLGDVANKSVIADAVRFTKWGTTTKKRGISSVWNSFPVRNVVQDWVNGTQPNYGFMVKAVDEGDKGRGGPVYEASEYAYDNNRRDYNLPKLVVTFGRPGVSVDTPTTITSTGAALTWPAYVDPTGSGSTADDIVEYQVHRSVYQTFVPSAATLVAPVGKTSLAYQDTTAIPTPTDETDPLKRHFYYYMIAVKTADGQVVAGPTQGVLLPKAGRITKVYRETAANQVPDTTLSAAQPTANVNSYAGDPYVSPGNNSSTYGDTRGLVRFTDLAGVPANANVVDAQLEMWNTGLYPGDVTDGKVDVHRLTRAFDETTATWNSAASGTAWTTPGGDYDPTAESYFDGFTNDPEWASWTVTNTVKSWLASPSTNYGFLLKMRDESVSTQRSMLLSGEGAEPLLRPTLRVTYLEPTAESTYYAPGTAGLMAPASSYPVTVSVSNPTTTSWTAANWELSYHWTLPDGTDVTTSGNQATTALPRDIAAGSTADVAATVKTPASSDANKRTDYVLKWELHNKTTGQWLSATAGIAPLDQKVAVEEPTSDQLGLEKFYAYAGKGTGAGSELMNNLYAGNTVWTYDPIANPSRGLSSFVRMAYNSQDTTDTVAGFGWSLQASSMMRLGTPLDFHPNPNPTTVKFTDGDGTTHTFVWNATANEWTSPKGVHLFLQRLVTCTPQTEQDRAWTLTRPDRTVFYYDCDGYLSATEDKNGNLMTFTYEVRRSQNKPTKFLKYVTDATGRQTLTLTYWAKGDTYDYVNDTTWTKVTGQANLTNPKIIDHVRSIVDVSGRTLTFTYTDKGLLGELVDGAGSTQPKVFGFQYDMTQGNKNVKLVKVTDPRGHATDVAYYDLPDDDPKFHWNTRSYTDRLGYPTAFAYTDPDGPTGTTIATDVLDAYLRPTSFLIDGFGRPTQITDALHQVTKLGWDGDHNVTRLEAADGAVSTWAFDPKTGYPTVVKDAEAVKNGWPGTTLAYQTGLNGHWADVIAKQSSEGRLWTFGYDTEGNLTSVTDPNGTATATPDDYMTTYAYDTWGQMQSATDANGNITAYGDYDANGMSRRVTDALNNVSTYEFSVRGQTTKATGPLGTFTTQTFDVFGRPLVSTVPKDQAGGVVLTVPAPTYDANNNIIATVAPNGAVTTSSYDDADQLVSMILPVDKAGDPERRTTNTYDRNGNLLTTTDPKGNLTATVGDFTTTNAYDELNRLVRVTDAAGQVTTYVYDSGGNVATTIDARKNATADPNDYTSKAEYDLDHRLTKSIDALGKFTTTAYDKDGIPISSTDQAGTTVTTALDPRGKPIEVKIPHVDPGGGVQYRITRTEYDEVGNVVKTTTPRGVDTTDDPDDFATVTVYDKLNRVAESRTAYDKDDARYKTPDSTVYTYDAAGRLAKVSAPPSGGQTVRNDTTFTYYDNGWTRTTVDAWDLLTTYDYDNLGNQTLRRLTSAGGSSERTMTWQYYPDGKLKARSDDGVPVGKQVALVDDTDVNNVTTTGTWTAATTATGFYGRDYATHPAGTGTDKFTWQLNLPQAGTYEVFVRYPSVAGAASDAKFAITNATGTVTKTVDQTTAGGQWVSLGSLAFADGSGQKIELSDAANGVVVADAVKLVRDNTGETDTEKQDFTYAYDPNGNRTSIGDASPNALVDAYAMTYDGLNQLGQVQEKKSGSVTNTTTFTYNEIGATKTVTHDQQYASYEFDARDLLSTVSIGATPTAPSPHVTQYAYTDTGQLKRQTKANGNTVDVDYYLDGLVKAQTEKTSSGTLVASHTLDFDANGNRVKDTASVMNADDNSAYLNTTTTYTYDPRDRLSSLTSTGAGARTESYIHDANNNVVSQNVKGTSTSFVYERNRLLTSSSGGVTSRYNYDPYGRLDTVSANGSVVQRMIYDGFDHVVENRSTAGGTTKVSKFTFDALDRTTSKTTDAGTADAETTTFAYQGLSGEVLDEKVAGVLKKTYEYSATGDRLAQVTHTGGTDEVAYYGYNSHSDVETLSAANGSVIATYGYSAFGTDNTDLFTGRDKPDPQNPDKDAYNTYRFNAKRVDPGTGTYDMGFRDYNPATNRFNVRDSYAGAMSDMGLSTDPFTGSRYGFGGGNPITNVEVDGHCGWNPTTWGDCVSDAWDATTGAVSDAWDATTDWVGDAWDATTDWVGDRWEDTKEIASDAWDKTKEIANDVKDWSIEHADLVGTVAGVLVGLGCTALTGGAGAIACGALGGLVNGLVTGGLQCAGGDQSHCGAGLLLDAVAGAALGAAGGALGALIGGAGAGLIAGARGGIGAAVRGIGSGFTNAAKGLIPGTGSAIRAFGARSLSAFAKGSLSNIRTEFAEKGLGGQALAIGKDLLKGMVTPDGIGAGAVGGAMPSTRSDAVGLFKQGPSFGVPNVVNIIGGMLGGGFQ